MLKKLTIIVLFVIMIMFVDSKKNNIQELQ